jgi:glycosyltransferase involved in cell wall biosynthesis
LQTNYLERYSMQNCDVAISPSRYMFQWARQNQIVLPARQHVIPYLFNPHLPKVGCRPPTNHVIFFGRLEIRKGLQLFLEALLELVRQPGFAGRPFSADPVSLPMAAAWILSSDIGNDYLIRCGFTPAPA